MKPIYRNIFFISLGVILVLLLIALVVFSRTAGEQAICSGVKVTVITDSAGVLAKGDVEEFVRLNVPVSTGRPVADIDLSKIEQLVSGMTLVSSAECYVDNKGFLRIDVTEAIPVMHVLGGNHDYCVDIDARQIQTPSKLRRGVALVDGRNVSLQFATGDLYSLICYIQRNGWSSEFTRFRVGAGNKVTMKSNRYGYDVCLGVPEGYVRKFDKLTRFRLTTPDHAKYHEINLDYYGQVVCK